MSFPSVKWRKQSEFELGVQFSLHTYNCFATCTFKVLFWTPTNGFEKKKKKRKNEDENKKLE